MLNAVAITNRASGAGARLARVELPFQQAFDPAEIDWEVCVKAELLVMFGGDGTLQHTTTDLLHYLSSQPAGTTAPPLAIVPFGTTNMSARTINTSRSRRRALQSLHQLLQRDSGSRLKTSTHRLLQIDNGGTLHYGFAMGLGAVTELVQEWQQQRSDAALLNRVRSLLTMVRGLSGADRGIPLTLNGDTHNLYVLVVTTLAELIYGTRPFWGSGREPQAAMRSFWIEAGTPGLLKLAPALLRGAPRLAGMQGLGSSAFDSLQLNFVGSFVLDGEIYQLRGNGLSISTHNSLRWIAL
jgi:hypothetical protein